MTASPKREDDISARLDALVVRFMAGHETPGSQPQTDLRRFVTWLTPYLHLWKEVELAMVVAKPSDTWIAMLCRCLLAERAVQEPLVLGTPCLQLIRVAHPIALLPEILAQIGQGVLFEDLTPLRAQVRLGDANAAPWQSLHGWPRDPVMASIGGPVSRFHRYELEFTTATALEREVEPGQAYEWLSAQRDQFEGAGHGKLMAQLKKLGLVVGQESLEGERRRRTLVVAPVPIHLADVHQSNDRGTVAVDVKAAATVRLDDVHVMLEMADSEEVAPRRGSPDGQGTATFHAVHPGSALVSLAYQGKVIDRHEVEVHAAQRTSARASAIAFFEGDQELLAKGLRPEDQTNPDNDAFERAVAHLLGLLGFSSLWWGSNRMKAGVPQDQADILAFPPHDGAVLVVDATVAPNKDPKVSKLIARAGSLEETLQAELEDPTFVAIPVLAVAAKQRVVPQGWSDSEVVVLPGEKLQDALEALRRGEEIESIWARLSTRIHDIFVRPKRRFSIW